MAGWSLSPAAIAQPGTFSPGAYPGEDRWKLPLQAPARPSGIQSMPLDQVLEVGLRQNPQMALAAERIEQARTAYRQRKTQKVPQLVLTNSTVIQRENAIDTGPLLDRFSTLNFPERFVLTSPVNNNFRLSLQVLLTTFGKVENEIAASFLQIDVESASADQQRLQLAYQLKQAFFAKLQADATVEVARLNLSVANQNLDDTRALFEQGVMSRYDILQAEIEVTAAVQDLAQNLTDVDQAFANLANVLAERRFYVQPIPPSPVRVESAIELADLEEFALERRPEMRYLRASREVAHKMLHAAYGESNPTVTLAASYQTHFGQSLSPLDLPSLTLNIQWPIFDGGLRRAKIDEAESVLRQLDAAQDQQANQIVLEVERSWLALQQTAFNLQTAEKQLANTVEYYDMARRRYLNGLATTLEVSDALRNLVAARSQLVEAHYQRDLAFAGLEQSLGDDIPDRYLSPDTLQDSQPDDPAGAATESEETPDA